MLLLWITAVLGLAPQCQTEHCRTCATNGDDGLEECNSCEGECAGRFICGCLVHDQRLRAYCDLLRNAAAWSAAAIQCRSLHSCASCVAQASPFPPACLQMGSILTMLVVATQSA